MDFSAISSILTSQMGLLAAIGVGSMLAVIGVGRALTDKGTAAERMKPKNQVKARGPVTAYPKGDGEFHGVAASFKPESAEERFAITIALAKAGFRGRKAVAGFYIMRITLALGLPVLVLLMITFARMPSLPDAISDTVGDLSVIGVAQIICLACAVGFFGPSLWLKNRIAQRRLAITQAFPNALDLIQIAVEAGLGFDQALTRVATEIQPVAPDLSDEILLAQNEIQAGREREKALMHMAQRTGVDEVASFVNVVLQSARFGTPMSGALKTYAAEMRLTRELRAQEKANKLPVQLSAVMASLMLPAILMMTLGPVVIRYIDYFSNNPAGG